MPLPFTVTPMLHKYLISYIIVNQSPLFCQSLGLLMEFCLLGWFEGVAQTRQSKSAKIKWLTCTSMKPAINQTCKNDRYRYVIRFGISLSLPNTSIIFATTQLVTNGYRGLVDCADSLCHWLRPVPNLSMQKTAFFSNFQ